MSPALAPRAHELLGMGLTPLRAMRVLRREFPHEERLDLHKVVGLGPTGINPIWTETGGSVIRPVIARLDPRR